MNKTCTRFAVTALTAAPAFAQETGTLKKIKHRDDFARPP